MPSSAARAGTCRVRVAACATWMFWGSACKVLGTAVGIARDDVEDTAIGDAVVPLDFSVADVLVSVATKLEVGPIVVVKAVLDEVASVVVVVGTELAVVVVTTELAAVLVTSEFAVVRGPRVVVAVVVASVAGSATAATTPRPSVVSATVSPNASTSAAPRRERTRSDAFIAAQPVSPAAARPVPNLSSSRRAVGAPSPQHRVFYAEDLE